MTKLLSLLAVGIIGVGLLSMSTPADAALGFVQHGVSVDTPGFISGLWHGMVAPYALLIGLFAQQIAVYATPNMGWIYDAGFLLGITISLPIGWILAIISLVLLIL